MVWLLIAVGLLARLPFMPIYGFKQDFLFLSSWGTYLTDHSVTTIYDKPEELRFGFVNYPPFYLYILTAVSRVHHLFFSIPLEQSRIFLCMNKCVTFLFEIFTALLLYHYVLKRKNSTMALYALGFYFLNPAIIYVSAYYGQLDAILAALLLASVLLMLSDCYFLSGCLVSCALLMKIQTIPFLPLFFFIPIARGQYKKTCSMSLGFLSAGLLILFPYICTGHLGQLLDRCVFQSIEWGKLVTVGAYNIWFLHADPFILDERIWGWLFGHDGKLTANPLICLLTYKNLGIFLFSSAYLLTLHRLWKNNDRVNILLAAAHLSLAFFMLPTKVHERYLFPFFVFYAPLALTGVTRLFLFFGFSLSYFVNLMAVCPLFREVPPLKEIDTPVGLLFAVVNIILYVLFLVYEYGEPRDVEKTIPRFVKVLSLTVLSILILIALRTHQRKENPGVLYLSRLTPTFVRQDWPLPPPEWKKNPPSPGYQQVGRDLSTENRELQIDGVIYRYGLGAHSQSRIEYEIPGEYTLFQTFAGVDAEALSMYELYPHRATITFEIRVNDEKRYESPLTIPTTPPRKINIQLPRIKGTNRLLLIVGNGEGRTESDHADWALARVLRTPE